MQTHLNEINYNIITHIIIYVLLHCLIWCSICSYIKTPICDMCVSVARVYNVYTQYKVLSITTVCMHQSCIYI